MGILSERLYSWVERNKILNEFQAGFRRNYSTADNIYNLASIVHINFQRNRKTYAFFVDFKAAFDKIPRNLLIFKLHEMGISSKTVTFIENVYRDTKSAVWTGSELSEEFTTVTGVKQGCLLSPLLFTLYLNDLHEFLEGGIHINNLNVRLLMYADDIVILADDVYVLRRMIKRLEEYCLLWAVEVNLEKSEIMVFRKGGRLAKEEDWQFRGQRIRVVSEYCYLGVTLTPSMSFSKHLQKRNQAAKNCINTTWSKFFSRQNISLQSKWKLFLAVCRSIQAYGAQVWGHALFDEVDNLQLFFVKKVLRLPSFTPTYALMLETGIENGYIFTLDLHMRYMAKTLFEYSEDRLPHKFSKIVLQKNIFWVKN